MLSKKLGISRQTRPGQRGATQKVPCSTARRSPSLSQRSYVPMQTRWRLLQFDWRAGPLWVTVVSVGWRLLQFDDITGRMLNICRVLNTGWIASEGGGGRRPDLASRPDLRKISRDLVCVPVTAGDDSSWATEARRLCRDRWTGGKCVHECAKIK